MANVPDKPPMSIATVLKFLNSERIRATYGAVAGIVGRHPIGVAPLLGRRRPEASWVVSKKTGDPTGYLSAERHADLKSRRQIISDTDDLLRRLRAWSAGQ
jgi:hypothetical protein